MKPVPPAVLDIAGDGRVLVFSFACVTSGTPRSWAATNERPGINLLTEISEASALQIGAAITHIERPGDLVVVSVHWGPNWGYDIPCEQRRFAHALIDKANVCIVHSHSSHHPRAMRFTVIGSFSMAPAIS